MGPVAYVFYQKPSDTIDPLDYYVIIFDCLHCVTSLWNSVFLCGEKMKKMCSVDSERRTERQEEMK